MNPISVIIAETIIQENFTLIVNTIYVKNAI